MGNYLDFPTDEQIESFATSRHIDMGMAKRSMLVSLNRVRAHRGLAAFDEEGHLVEVVTEPAPPNP